MLQLCVYETFVRYDEIKLLNIYVLRQYQIAEVIQSPEYLQIRFILWYKLFQ